MIIIKLILYFFWVPLFVFITRITIKAIKMNFRKSMRIRNQRNQKPDTESFSSRLYKGVKFELKGDKRPLSNKLHIQRAFIFWLILLLGLILNIMSYSGNNKLFMYSLPFSLMGIIYAYCISKKILEEQQNMLQRLYDTKNNAMGLVSKNTRDSIPDYDSEFKVLSWSDDKIHFNKILLYIPTSFDELNTQLVIQKFNQNFGGDTAWVADVDSETKGWDFVRGMVILKRTPALPLLASWSEHYLLNDKIAWSFFPIGLGVEAGVSLVNPETKETEHVLGFDLQGLEGKLGKKKGFDVGPEIVAAPQVLIAGGTGGGKSLSEETIVPKIIEDTSNADK